MILSIFKKNYTLNVVFVFAYFILCGILNYYFTGYSVTQGSSENILLENASLFFQSANLFRILFLVFFGFIISFYLNSLMIKHGLLARNTMIFPGLLFLFTLAAANYSQSPVFLLSLILIIVFLQLLLSMPTKSSPYDESFYASFLISILGFIWSPLYLYVILVWFSFIIFRIFTWREWFISILGFVSPLIFYGTYLYVFDRLQTIIQVPYLFLINFHFPNMQLDTNLVLWISFVGIFLVISFLKSVSISNDQNINYRKKMAVLNLFTLISLVIILFSGVYFKVSILLIGISVSFYLTKFILEIKNNFIAGIIFFLINAGLVLRIVFGS